MSTDRARRTWVDVLPTLVWLIAVGVAIGVLVAIG
jgi:hypothetical protein